MIKFRTKPGLRTKPATKSRTKNRDKTRTGLDFSKKADLNQKLRIKTKPGLILKKAKVISN